MLKLIPALVAGLVSVLASCSGHTASTTPRKGPCNADAAQSLIGKPKPTDVEAMRITNSKTIRQIEPGQMVTHDFREDRVTIETDPASGLVVGAKCG
ncbi:I78 family peptidase inhibitor [Rhizobium brockwellii]|uniref:I78 family peptidase inhibitor n=1 Tax=Rhizobium brockwellii TaxID=3019932 RepID=A0ABU3YVX4_9HYPH|nr:I78 family peptidase inhibitor [Rhizobium brockwellii]MDV4183139.1 I78 family peptidase inhibitor [Rhizobium brockwellii]MDV4189978.1 I78 family peptidase inhibitor [Rhizobium brockwellii]